MTLRTKQLTKWVSEKIGVNNFSIKPASSDASFRRYFRIKYDNKSLILMDAPPEKEDSRPFVSVGKMLLDVGLNVPEILEQDLEQGFLLLSDLGDRQYLQALTDSSAAGLYSDAISALSRMQSGVDISRCGLPHYDETLLLNEMELFREWYLTRQLKLELNSGHHALLDDMFALLIQSASEQPVVCVHRDYHSRNLMVTQKNNPGILDFQDAVTGPVTYDLVSLLRDCYIAWPRKQVESWVKQYCDDISSGENYESIGVAIELNQFLSWFDLMGVQRHLKAIGIFARLNIRDAKPGYLNDIPRTLNYIIDVCQRTPELEPQSRFLKNEVQPLLTKN